MTWTSEVDTVPQGDLRLLDHPIAQRLLTSGDLARLAFNALDSTPRVIPIGFVWNGTEIVMSTFAKSSKLVALRAHPDAALTIDRFGPPPDVLLVRGRIALDAVDGVPEEYEQMQIRDHGPERGAAIIADVRRSGARMVRMILRPAWVGALDFQTRFPGGLVAAGLAGQGSS